MAVRLWAGLDVGAETTRVCVIDAAGDVVHAADCRTDLKCVIHEIALMRRYKRATVGLESGPGIQLARGLRDRGYQVDIYEARQLSKFLRMRRNKTDARDANGIAQAGRLAAPLVSKVYLKSFDCQALGMRLRIRRFLIQARNRAFCLICRQLELFGGRLKSKVRSVSLADEVRAQVRQYLGKQPNAASADLLGLLDHCLGLIARETALNRELESLANEIDVCRKMMEIPGVGPICSLSFYAAIGDPHRFRRTAAVGAYLGLTPRIHQSGLTRKSGRISRMGNREARAMLVSASIRFMGCTAPGTALRDWAMAVEERRGRRKARIALARKLAMVMLAVWKSGDPYRGPVVRKTRDMVVS